MCGRYFGHPLPSDSASPPVSHLTEYNPNLFSGTVTRNDNRSNQIGAVNRQDFVPCRGTDHVVRLLSLSLSTNYSAKGLFWGEGVVRVPVSSTVLMSPLPWTQKSTGAPECGDFFRPCRRSRPAVHRYRIHGRRVA